MSPTLLKETVSTLLATLDVAVSDITVKEGHRTIIAVRSDDSKRLIGPHGEHLRSLNTIARRLVEAKHGEEAANFSIDVNGYHEQLMEAVRANARMLAQRARLFKHDVEMSPMSPYERLVVHELFAEDPEIKTESAGEGKFRHIVLKYRSPQGVTASA
ncbi:MAG: R3H domain-containing nucleic acid-binding protein [Patescibacteria group bacterium]